MIPFIINRPAGWLASEELGFFNASRYASRWYSRPGCFAVVVQKIADRYYVEGRHYVAGRGKLAHNVPFHRSKHKSVALANGAALRLMRKLDREIILEELAQ